MKTINRFLINKLTKEAVVIFKKRIAPHVFHIRISGKEIKSIKHQPGQYLHVLVNPNCSGSILRAAENRSYSVWSINPAEGIMDLAVCTFSGGIGAEWILSLEVGEKVFFTGPTGKFVLSPTADTHIFTGDLSSLAHFYQMRRALKSSDRYTGIIYGNSADDYFPDLDGNYFFSFLKSSSIPVREIENRIHEYLPPDLSATTIYLGGEGITAVELYKRLKEKYPLQKNQLFVKPFWVPDKKGL